MSIPSRVSRFFEDGLGFKSIFQNICMSLLSPGLPQYPHGDTPPRFPTVFLVRVVKTTARATASNKAQMKNALL